MKKPVYTAPQIKVVAFQVENGFTFSEHRSTNNFVDPGIKGNQYQETGSSNGFSDFQYINQ